ncbi:Cystatin-A [Orchesella cincta]|uniref:Cystatin-A n=1 Tax=Orchesella cincta TaxID=48709 RepID=A0A1D2M7N8_ORCCI|nr:Cystatin-A [Orchesella cincta]
MFSITLKIVLIAVIGASIARAEMMTGGLTDERQPSTVDKSSQVAVDKLSDEIKSQVSKKLASSSGNAATIAESFKNENVTVLSFKTQVVAGTNYFVKARIGKYIFLLRIYQDLQGAYELSNVKGPISEADQISYF